MKKILIFFTLIFSSIYGEINCTKMSNIQSFVNRFYINVLERSSENTGLDQWTNQLIFKEKTASDVAKGFILSDEFMAKNKNNSEYLHILYRAFFNREADTAGLNGWLTHLSDGMSRESILDNFLASQEFINLSGTYGIQAYEGAAFESVEITNFVQHFYQVVLGRTADADGLKYWTSKLSTGELAGEDIAFGFIFSAEYNGEAKDNAVYINTLYSAFFDRVADISGFNYWMAALNNGLSKREVLSNFLRSQEFVNLSNSYGILAYRGAPTPPAVVNNAPVAIASSDKSELLEGENIVLSSANSTDSDGNIVCYWWRDGSKILDLTASFTKNDFTVGRHSVVLTVVDNVAASTSDTITFIVAPVPNDRNAPDITILGSNPLILSVGDIYVEAGATAVDDVDGAVAVTISGTVNTAVVDTYIVRYTSQDSSFNTVISTRTVRVEEVVISVLKKTGQINSYNATGTEVLDSSIKDDGFYQSGISPNYTRDDDKNVTIDSITDLMWQDNTDVSIVEKPWILQVNSDLGDFNNTSGDTANTYCSNLSLGGYADWRLPSIDELVYITDKSTNSPAINSTVFENTASGFYWTATVSARTSARAWFVDFVDGEDYNNNSNAEKNREHYIRCVRNNP